MAIYLGKNMVGGLAVTEDSSVKLLWTNPSPSSSFSAQTITVNLSGYKTCGIEYRMVNNDQLCSFFMHIVSGDQQRVTIGASGSSNVAVRDVTPKRTELIVGGGYFGGSSNNNYVIPYKIYGLGSRDQSDILPSEYKEVQYISFPSGSYIDTNVSINTDSIFTEIKTYESSTYISDMHYFGVDASNGMCYHFTTYGNKYYWASGNTERNGGTWASGEKIIKFNDASNNYEISVNGTVLGSGYSAPNMNDTIKIGRRSSNANFVGNVYYCIMKENVTGVTVRHLVPCVRVSDSVVGMYDIAGQSFYTNSGTGTFTAGPYVI